MKGVCEEWSVKLVAFETPRPSGRVVVVSDDTTSSDNCEERFGPVAAASVCSFVSTVVGS